MLKQLLSALVLCATLPTNAQITLEHIYPTEGFFDNYKQFMMVHLEASGSKYVAVDKAARTITLYHLDHTLYKTISFANAPPIPYPYQPYIMYISEHLFDQDDDVEFMFTVLMNPDAITMIYDEDGGVLLDATDGYPGVLPTYHNQHYPIYNTTEGTKLILSFEDGTAHVYSLAGTLSTDIASAGQDALEEALGAMVFPNPSTGSATILLPRMMAQGSTELRLTNALGELVRVVPVVSNSSSVDVDLSALAAGSYVYAVVVDGTVTYTGTLVRAQ